MAEPVIRIADIQQAVCDWYHISRDDMLSPARKRKIAHPRQLGMYLSRRMTARSLPEIGYYFGGRHHTTVLHGIRNATSLIERDANYRWAAMNLARGLGLSREDARQMAVQP